jgi:hypothetical protein
MGKRKFSAHIPPQNSGYLTIQPSIYNNYPQLERIYKKAKGKKSKVQWQGQFRREVLEAMIPAATGVEFQAFWNSQEQRNQLSHQLGGISEAEVFGAWGANIQHELQWKLQILTCLNILTGQSFVTLEQASLFAVVQKQAREAIEQIELL